MSASRGIGEVATSSNAVLPLLFLLLMVSPGATSSFLLLER